MYYKIVKLLILFIIGISFSNVKALDTSKSSIVMETETGRILYQNNIDKKLLIASTTKIMTAILTIENTDINKNVVVGNEILSMYGTNIYLEVNEIISIKDLLYGLLLRSGNDAAVVLAKAVGTTEKNFISLMNEKAKELGMRNTIFQNPHGLDDETKNYSTAYDMALLSSYANKNKIYQQIVGTKKYITNSEKKTYIWYNRNKLLTKYNLCTGGKNGYTPKAGRTLVSTANNGNINLTAVTLNDPNEYDTHEFLYNKCFKKYKMYKIVDKRKFQKKHHLTIKSSFYYPLTTEEKERIKTEIKLYKEDLRKSKGQVIVKLDENVIGNLTIYQQKQKMKEKTLFQTIKNYLLEILKKLKLGRQNSLKPGPLVPTPPDTNNLVLPT